MQPLTFNDDDMLVYCDWLEDSERSEEASALRQEILDPIIEGWQPEFCSYIYVGPGTGGRSGVGGGIYVRDQVGGINSQFIAGIETSGNFDKVGGSNGDGVGGRGSKCNH